MAAVRRTYVYLLAFAGLTALGLGVANLIRALLDQAVQSDPATVGGADLLRIEVASWGAAALVGLPVWLFHWAWARRLAVRDTAERASSLRRLYLYAVLAGATLVAAPAVNESLGNLVGALVFQPRANWLASLPPLPLVVVGVLLGVYHWHAASEDRAVVGEQGASATLRRWYVYAGALIGFAVLLAACAQLLAGTWLMLVAGPVGRPAVADAGPTAVVGLALWLLLWVVLPARLTPAYWQQDQQSTLRTVYLFAGLTLAVGGCLISLSQVLYYGLAKALGVADPGGAASNLLEAAAAPTSAAVVNGFGWFYQRQAIQRQARIVETRRQAGVRRLYTYTLALAGLAILAVGLGGLLWIAADAVSHSPDTQGADWWRDRVSLFAMLALVGLPVWVLHWRPVQPADAGALTRRLYLYLTLIGGVLGILGSGVAAVNALLLLTLGSPSIAAPDLAHMLAILAVAAAVSAYHWQVLRRDQMVQVTEGTEAVQSPVPAEIVVRLSACSESGLASGLAVLAERGIRVERVGSEN